MTRRGSAAISSLSPIVLLILIMAAPPFGTRASAEPPDRESVLREIETTVDSYLEEEAYRLRFSQENYWSLADSVFVTGAVLTARPPGSLSIRYDDGGRIVAFAGTLRVFIPQTGQFFVSRVDSTDLTIDPASVLKSYRLHPDEPVVACDERHLTVRLLPAARFMEPARVDVTIDRTTHLVTRLSANTSSGDRSTYIIETTDLGVSIPESEFQLAPPPGVRVQSGSPYDYGDVGS